MRLFLVKQQTPLFGAGFLVKFQNLKGCKAGMHLQGIITFDGHSLDSNTLCVQFTFLFLLEHLSFYPHVELVRLKVKGSKQ